MTDRGETTLARALPILTRTTQRRLPLLLLRTFSILVGAAALLYGGRALDHEVRVFGGPPRRAFPPAFRAQLQTVTGRLPPGAVVLLISASPEYWYSRLWQRALYPRNDSIVIQPPLSPERLQGIRSKYGARFVISAGDPPFEPGHLWRIDLGEIPGLPGESWFGELGP